MRPEPLTKDKINFENLVENYQVKIVNPISFENTDKQGYPIWSFKLNNDKNLNPDCDYILISRLELIRLFKERVQYLLKEIEKEIDIETNEYKKSTKTPYDKGYIDGFRWGMVDASSLIKKAFKGVLEE